MAEKTKTEASSENSIQKMAKGTMVVFIGTLLGLLFAFVSRIIIVRVYGLDYYGVFSIGFTILGIAVSFGLLGLSDGVARQISYNLGKNQKGKVKSIIFYAILFGLLGSLILFVFVFFGSSFISKTFLNSSQYSYVFKVFAIAIPYFIIIDVFTAIFRGFHSVKERVIFADGLRNLFFLLILGVLIYIGLSFEWVIYSYLLSLSLTAIFFAIYFIYKKSLIPIDKIKSKYSFGTGKELLFFSLPLLFLTILYQIMGWTDTLMLGYFTNPELVGIYNVAQPLGRFVLVVFECAMFIYMPIISALYAKDKFTEMKRTYIVLTKWLVAVAFPLVIIFLIFPEEVISILFGSESIAASTALQIFAIGFFVRIMFGLNGATLTAMGKIKFLMYATFVAASINIILNWFLIPIYGVNGAALSTVLASFFIWVIRTIKLHSISKIQPFSKNMIKPTILSIFFSLVIYYIVSNYVAVSIWIIIAIFAGLIAIYLFSMLVTKSFEAEDIDLIVNIEKKTGIRLTFVKNLIKRFL